MFALVLAGALIAQMAQGAPTNCGELCEQSTGSYNQHQSWGSHSSYSKQSRYNSHGGYSSGSQGLGVTGGRLEDFDENAVIGTTGLDRPGSWHDQKHYVTNDGKGEMNYEAGQTVTNNGYSKYASHSYSYGSHDNHAPRSNSQVLSTSEFNNELQSIRSRIASFMGNFNLGSSSLVVNSNFLEDFKHKANLISSQLNDVCGQVDVGSSMYQQMQQEIQQFQRQVEERQRQIEATISHTSSSSISTSSHGSLIHYPANSPRPAPIVRPDENAIFIQQQQQRRIEEEISKVQNLINGFYSNFGRADSDVKFQEDFNSQVNIIIQKFVDLNSQAQINESQRQRIENLKNNYETYVASIRARIQEKVRRDQEEIARRQQRLQEIENARIRIENEDKAKMLKMRLDEDRLRQQAMEAERQRIETEKKRQEEEAENRRRLKLLDDERIRLQNEEINAEQTIRQNENLQIQLDQQQRQLELLHAAQTSKPQVTGSVQMTGSTTVQHTVTGLYGSTENSGTAGSYTRPLTLAPHVDLTAAVNRLQQELNRVQTEVNNFNSYRMRLTADNKYSIVNEAKQKYDKLLQNLDSICQTSTSYNNQNILNSAQELQRNFERLYQSFKNEADSISSNSQTSISGGYKHTQSSGSSGTYQTVQQPKIGNIQYTHEKSTEIEIGSSRRPVQHYSSGSGYSQSSGYRSYGSSGADDNFRSSVLDLGGGAAGGVYSSSTDCFEQQAGQPCIVPPRRYRRHVGDYGPIFDQPDYIQPREDYSQQYVIPSLDYYQNTGHIELPQDHQPIRNSQFDQQHASPLDDFTRQPHDIDNYYYRRRKQESHNLYQQHQSYVQNEELDSLQNSRNQNIDVFGHKSQGHIQSGSAHQTGQFTLEKSGFNDYNQFTEKSNLNILTTPRPTYDHSQQKFGDTLQNSGFSDYVISSTENPQQVNPIRNHKQPRSREFTLENSGFNDGVIPLASENLQSSQQTENLTEQQNTLTASSDRNQRLEKFDDFEISDLTQQTATQVDFGPESQVGRSFSSHDLSKPERYSQNNTQQSLQEGNRSRHPTGHYIDNLSQQHQQAAENLQEVGSGYSSGYIENGETQTERSYTNIGSQNYISTIRPTVRPAPKPVPRYSRPWQVIGNNNPKQIDSEQRSIENTNTNIEQSTTPKSVKPLRGDLPGQSESSTLESITSSLYDNIPITSIRPSITPKSYNDFGLEQQYEQVNLNINHESDGLQNSRNDGMQNYNGNNQLGQFDRTYYLNHNSSFHHNFSYSQNSDYFIQQGSNTDSYQTVQNPLNQLETQSQDNDYNQQSTYQFYENQSSHSNFEQSSNYNSKPRNLENNLSDSTSQNVFDQQTQFPLFEQFNQQQETSQRSEDLLSADVIPLDGRRSFDTRSENTTPSTFWKKIGQKISHTYDKAKEKAKNIFG